MLFSLSSGRILDRVYAVAALRALSENPSDERLPLLTRAEEPALKRVLADAACRFVVDILPMVTAVDLDADPMTIELDGRFDGVEAAVLGSIEELLAARTLSLAYGGSDPGASEFFARRSDAALESLKSTASGAPGRIMPCWL